MKNLSPIQKERSYIFELNARSMSLIQQSRHFRSVPRLSSRGENVTLSRRKIVAVGHEMNTHSSTPIQILRGTFYRGFPTLRPQHKRRIQT